MGEQGAFLGKFFFKGQSHANSLGEIVEISYYLPMLNEEKKVGR